MVKEKVVVFAGILSLCLLFFVLNMSSPDTSGPIGIFGVFVMIYTLFTSLFTEIFFYTRKNIEKIKRNNFLDNPVQRTSFCKSFYLGSVAGLLPILLIIVQSSGGASFGSVALVLFFIFLAFFYVIKRY